MRGLRTVVFRVVPGGAFRVLPALVLTGLMILPVFPSRISAQQELRLTLQDCIRMGMENNLDIQVSRFDPRIAETEITRQKAAFDPTFTSTTRNTDNTTPVFIENQLSAFQRKEEILGWEDRLHSGFSYNVDIRGFRDVVSVATDVDPGPQILLGDLSLAPVYQSSFTINFTQPLLKGRGGKINQTQIRVANNNVRISESQFRQTVLDTLKGVEEAYWELVFATRDLDVRKKSLERARRFLRENKVKVEVGTLAPIEITTAEAEVASRREDVIVGENALEDAEDNLRVLITSTDNPLWEEKIIPTDRPPFVQVNIDMKTAIEKAFANRPDLQQQRLTIENEAMNLRFQKNQRKYGLDLQGSYGAAGLVDTSVCLLNNPFPPPQCLLDNPRAGEGLKESFDDVINRDFDSWNLGVILTVPLGNRDAKSQYAATRLRQEKALVNNELLHQRAIQEIRRAGRQIETDQQRVAAARVNVRLQNEKLEAEERKYENGMSTSFQVLTFQEDLADAERSHARALIDYNVSLAELDRVTGVLHESLGVVIE